MSAPASEPREEEPVAGRGERLRVALGSLLLGALLLLLLLAAGSMPAFDPDLFWVAASGRWMLEHLDVPRQNLFSFTAPEQPWVMHEWGFGPLYAWGLARFGAPFLNALSMLGIVALAGLLLRGTFWRSRRLEAPFLVALFALALAGIHMVSARPTIFARLFPLGMLLLAFSPRFSRRHALGAVVLEWVWASCHGSFPLGIVMLGISAFEDQERRRLRILACAGAAAITFIGPYGWGLHRLVFEYATGASESVGLVHESILEFRSIADLGPD
ncbi:MAG: hypothetical protein OEY14_17060, partial [Myxococcales bacterium]|nr:hypothetical protein [Myxococcales bacterium]